jgi:hypothetical protein
VPTFIGRGAPVFLILQRDIRARTENSPFVIFEQVSNLEKIVAEMPGN